MTSTVHMNLLNWAMCAGRSSSLFLFGHVGQHHTFMLHQIPWWRMVVDRMSQHRQHITTSGSSFCTERNADTQLEVVFASAEMTHGTT